MTKVIADEKKSNGNSDVASADVKEKLPVESVEKESKCGAQPPPLDGGWGWMIVFAAFMVHVVTDGITYSFTVFHEAFMKYFECSNAQAGWVTSILVGVTLGSGPIASYLVNKFSCKTVAIGGAILASVCFLASSQASNVYVLYFTISIGGGFGFGLIYLPAIISVTIYFEKWRALATGIAVCGSGVGTMVLAPLLGKIEQLYGWQMTAIAAAALILTCILYGLTFRPLELEKSAESEPLKDEELLRNGSLNKKEEVGGEPAKPDDSESVIELFKDVIFVLFAVSNFLTSMGFNVPYEYLRPYAETNGVHKDHALYLITLIGFANIMGRIAAGLVSDWHVIKKQRLMVYNSVVTICGLATALCWVNHSYMEFSIYAIIFGFTSGAYVSLTSVCLVDLMGLGKLTNAFGALLSFQGTASLLGIPLAGYFKDIHGDYALSFIIPGVMIFISGVMLYPVPLLQARRLRIEKKMKYNQDCTVSIA